MLSSLSKVSRKACVATLLALAPLAIVEAAPSSVTLVAPVGIEADATPEYVWQAESSASWYFLWVNAGGENLIRQWYSAESVGCAGGTGTCSITPAEAVTGASATWWVRTWNPTGPGPWSDPYRFTASTLDPPSALAPAGNFAGETPEFLWGLIDDSIRYQLWIVDANGNNVFQKWYEVSDAVCGVDAEDFMVSPLVDLPNGGTWWVRGGDEDQPGPWSNGTVFSP